MHIWIDHTRTHPLSQTIKYYIRLDPSTVKELIMGYTTIWPFSRPTSNNILKHFHFPIYCCILARQLVESFQSPQRNSDSQWIPFNLHCIITAGLGYLGTIDNWRSQRRVLKFSRRQLILYYFYWMESRQSIT